METDHQEQESESRRPAPGGLAVLEAFLNTVDIESGEEAFADPGGLQRWLVERGLLEPDPALGDADLRLAVALREAVRALAYANHEGHPDPGALTTLNRIAAGARLRVRFGDAGEAGLEPDAPGIDGAIGRLLAILYAAMEDGTWGRFKACRRSTCRWAFYDRSRNRSSSWCSMAVCGNREKAKAYRRRRRGAEA